MEIATDCELWLNSSMISERDFLRGTAHRLRVIRLGHEMTQEQLGEIMRVKKSAVSNYEAGARAVDPYAAFLLKQKYEVPLEFLYLGVEGGVSRDLAKKIETGEAKLAQEAAKAATKGRGRRKSA